MTKRRVFPNDRQWSTSSSRRLNCFWKLAIILAAKLADVSTIMSGTDWAMSDKTSCEPGRSAPARFFQEARRPL